MSITGNLFEDKWSFPWKPALIFTLFTVGILVLISIYYRSQKARIFEEQKDNLSAVSVLKLNQIELWRQERMGDAKVIKGNQLLVDILDHFIQSNDPGSKQELQKWVGSIRYQYDYSDILVVDTALNIKMSFSHSGLRGKYNYENEVHDMLSNMSIQMTDIKRNDSDGTLCIDILIPLISKIKERTQLFGILVLRIDPTLKLFPIIKLWPTSSNSSETLLLRSEGDSILYLNELRHKSNTALNLRLPRNIESLLASIALRGKLGLVEGVDYRGVPVVGYISAVPHFPWFMIAKTDKSELLTQVNKTNFDSILISLLVLLINTFLFLNWNRSQRIKALHKKLANESVINELNEKFYTAFHRSPVSLVISLQASNQFIDVNDTFTRDTEYTREEVLGKTAGELNFWFDYQERFWVMNEIAENGIFSGKVLKFRTKSGKLMYGLTSISVISVNGEPCNLITVVNITESKNSEHLLLESEKLFRNLFENMLNGFAYCKMLHEDGQPLDFLYIKVNKAFVNLTQLHGVEGKRVSEVIPGIQMRDQDLLQRYLRVSVSGEPETFETYVESMKMWFLISVYSPEKDYFVAVFDVITERKNVEASLLESEDKFKYVFDNSMIGKSITLPNGLIQVNKAFCNMTGYSKEELSGLSWQDISHPDDIELNQNAVNSLLSGTKDSVRFNKRYIRKNGTILWVDISSTLRRDKNGKPLYFLTSLNDITEQKNAEEVLKNYSKNLEESVIHRTEQLEAANKELEAFTYSVSHDLRAPLRAVHGFTKILKEDYDNILDDEGRRICSVISSSANQMSDLIDDLLSFSRIGRSTMSPALLNMELIAGSIANDLISQEQNKVIKLSIGKLNEVKGDPNLIKHVWHNLISNAIKYSSKHISPEILITSRKVEDYIVFEVKDNGVGFDMQYADKLFGVFQRLHSENEFEGNGVGLAIVKRIIAKHGGEIWAESEVGNGATFSFSMPAGTLNSISEQ